MSLQDKIEEYKKMRKITKAEKLKEYEKEIKEMIDLRVPLRKQIDFILEEGILEKLDIKEYRNILKNHFGYSGGKKQRVFKEKEYNQKAQKIQTKETQKNKNIDPVKELSKDVNILDFV